MTVRVFVFLSTLSLRTTLGSLKLPHAAGRRPCVHERDHERRLEIIVMLYGPMALFRPCLVRYSATGRGKRSVGDPMAEKLVLGLAIGRISPIFWIQGDVILTFICWGLAEEGHSPVFTLSVVTPWSLLDNSGILLL
ncbi:hypothetical protein EDB81DRAFT_823323 [Dactylonectria macrodidyma]|uniref:Secreted protein n=1 Tax=Dactylonectria macrodidyma TaxID=307937 RepID=A0A9P9D7U5_9HYPO|nr:hypothetical protein EDB81DRAFT_823323 [Dactylonectria macrodidyma]